MYATLLFVDGERWSRARAVAFHPTGWQFMLGKSGAISTQQSRFVFVCCYVWMRMDGVAAAAVGSLF